MAQEEHYAPQALSLKDLKKCVCRVGVFVAGLYPITYSDSVDICSRSNYPYGCYYDSLFFG